MFGLRTRWHLYLCLCPLALHPISPQITSSLSHQYFLPLSRQSLLFSTNFSFDIVSRSVLFQLYGDIELNPISQIPLFVVDFIVLFFDASLFPYFGESCYRSLIKSNQFLWLNWLIWSNYISSCECNKVVSAFWLFCRRSHFVFKFLLFFIVFRCLISFISIELL